MAIGLELVEPAASCVAGGRNRCHVDAGTTAPPLWESKSGDSFQDARWLERVRQGDEEAASALVQRLYPTVLKSVRCHLPRRCSEEDLAQAVFAKIFAKLGQFSGRVPLEHWVARITINTCLSELGREKVRPELRMSDLSEEDQAVVEHLLSTEADLPIERGYEARELLGKLLSCLKPDERLVISLLHLEERSTGEISELTGWSISHVKVKAFRARQKMRKSWDKLVKRCNLTGVNRGI